MKSAIDRAIDLFDGQAGLAKACGVSQPAVHGWQVRQRVTAERAIQIERVTDGRVTRHELRPDIDWSTLDGRAA